MLRDEFRLDIQIEGHPGVLYSGMVHGSVLGIPFSGMSVSTPLRLYFLRGLTLIAIHRFLEEAWASVSVLRDCRIRRAEELYRLSAPAQFPGSEQFSEQVGAVYLAGARNVNKPPLCYFPFRTADRRLNPSH